MSTRVTISRGFQEHIDLWEKHGSQMSMYLNGNLGYVVDISDEVRVDIATDQTKTLKWVIKEFFETQSIAVYVVAGDLQKIKEVVAKEMEEFFGDEWEWME